jgi:hypothetical protein
LELPLHPVLHPGSSEPSKHRLESKEEDSVSGLYGFYSQRNGKMCLSLM